jgi:hypothetical protein
MIKSLGSIMNDRSSYLARDNLNKLHAFGHGNLKCGLLQILVANIHFCLQYKFLTYYRMVKSLPIKLGKVPVSLLWQARRQMQHNGQGT